MSSDTFVENVAALAPDLPQTHRALVDYDHKQIAIRNDPRLSQDAKREDLKKLDAVRDGFVEQAAIAKITEYDRDIDREIGRINRDVREQALSAQDALQLTLDLQEAAILTDPASVVGLFDEAEAMGNLEIARRIGRAVLRRLREIEIAAPRRQTTSGHTQEADQRSAFERRLIAWESADPARAAAVAALEQRKADFARSIRSQADHLRRLVKVSDR